MGIINDKFMLNNKIGYGLYHDFAKNLPIIDYHCHLDVKFIAENHKFKNVGELLLGGDHYKWRLLRANGVEESFVTGDADDYEKFFKWAETIPMAIGNPLFHWQQLEMKRYFDIDDILTEKNAKEIWDKCNERLKGDDYTARGLIKKSGVEVVCTTDDPADTLEYHKNIKESDFKTKVLPTFRPDNLIDIEKNTFVSYMEKNNIKDISDLEKWISDRVEHFDNNGCVIADHSLSLVPYKEGDADKVLKKALKRETLSPEEAEIYKTYVLCLCAKEYKKRNWVMQIHMGALRNNNSKMFGSLGGDAGFDSMNDLPIAEKVAGLLNSFSKNNFLPKIILYALNPASNYPLITMMGNFQEGPEAAKIQFGSGWWYNDQKDGMRQQMKDLAALGLLSKFVGMLTDSRSFVSYPRHEYFRRILCNLIGEWVEAGEYPYDYELLKKIVEGICYYNAKEYFGF